MKKTSNSRGNRDGFEEGLHQNCSQRSYQQKPQQLTEFEAKIEETVPKYLQDSRMMEQVGTKLIFELLYHVRFQATPNRVKVFLAQLSQCFV